MFLKNLIVGSIVLMLAGSATSRDASPSGVMEGHLKILSSKPVDIGDENAATVTPGNYPDYPLLILSGDGKKRNRAGDCGREWKLSRRLATRRLYSGSGRTNTRTHTRAHPRKTAAGSRLLRTRPSASI